MDERKVRYFDEVVRPILQPTVGLDKIVDNLVRSHFEQLAGQITSQGGLSYGAWLEEEFAKLEVANTGAAKKKKAKVTPITKGKKK